MNAASIRLICRWHLHATPQYVALRDVNWTLQQFPHAAMPEMTGVDNALWCGRAWSKKGADTFRSGAAGLAAGQVMLSTLGGKGANLC